MSYVQGTVVKVNVSFTDPANANAALDPTDVVVQIYPPGKTAPSSTLMFSTGGVVKLAVGEYRFSLDTSAAAGQWSYQATGTGPNAVVKNRTLRVLPRLLP